MSSPTNSRDGTIPQLQHAKNPTPGPRSRGNPSTTWSNSPLPAKHLRSFSLAHIFLAFLLNLNIATNAFWRKQFLQKTAYSSTLCCTKKYFQAFISKPQRLDRNFYFWGGRCCCWLVAVQQYIEAEFMSHNFVFKIEWKREQVAGRGLGVSLFLPQRLKLSNTARQTANHDTGIRITDQNQQKNILGAEYS